jgi:hypothetical protein
MCWLNTPNRDVSSRSRSRRQRRRYSGWASKDEQPAHVQNEWFVLVALGEAEVRPRYFVLPTDVVAGWLYVDPRLA